MTTSRYATTVEEADQEGRGACGLIFNPNGCGTSDALYNSSLGSFDVLLRITLLFNARPFRERSMLALERYVKGAIDSSWVLLRISQFTSNRCCNFVDNYTSAEVPINPFGTC